MTNHKHKITIFLNASITLEVIANAPSCEVAEADVRKLLESSEFSLLVENHPVGQVGRTEFAEIDSEDIEIAQVKAAKLDKAALEAQQQPTKELVARRIGKKVIMEFLKLRQRVGDDVDENREEAFGTAYDLSHEIIGMLSDLYDRAAPGTFRSTVDDPDDDDEFEMAWW